MAGTHARTTHSGRQGPAADDPVLMSKITIPGLPGWTVPRPRIDRLIAAGTHGPLTTVTGPPGAGKTMAITSWAAASTDPGIVAWIALDEYDNRPRVFWSYVLAALRQAGIAVPRIWPAAGRGTEVGHVFLLRLASALASLGRPVVLVIEDFHLLADADILDGLSYVLRNAAPGLRLVISSRIQPLLPLHRYRLNGDLVEIRAEDLAFSVAESGSLLAQLGIRLSEASLECLTERTEGWAAGIRLAAISLDGHPDPEQFVKELGAEDSAVTGYLVEEVLNAQPPPLRDFLLRTSILDQVNVDIAGVLNDDKRTADLLPALAAANAFIRPLGHGWYRYHSLFADILRLKLRRESSGQLPDLHRRAASWYRRNGYLAEAVRHAGAAGDWEPAARMVLDDLAIGELLEPHDGHSLADEFRQMPADPAGPQPQLHLVAAAMELASGADAIGSTLLRAAESTLGRLPAHDEIPARLAAALIRIALCRRTGDLDCATAAAARAETLLGQIPESLLAHRPSIRAQVLLGRGIVEFWAGDLDQAAETFEAGAAVAPETSHERADCLGQHSLAEALRGRLSRALQLAGEAAGPAEAGDKGHAGRTTAAASVALACAHLERNELRRAHDDLMQADAALRMRPDKLMCAVANLIAARCRLAQGYAGGTLELLSRARRSCSPPRWLELRLTLLESRACAVAGDIGAAVDAARRAEAQAAAEAPAALAYAWLAAGDQQAAAAALAIAPAGGRDKHEQAGLDGSLVEARLSYGSGDCVRGRRSLERALQLGKPEQIRLPFALERAWLRPVLRRDPDLARSYRQLLEPDVLSAGSVPATPPVTGRAPPLVVDRLSEREREVLQRLSGMLSTAEIASEMYISVNTVKTHLKNIYRKLSADHRGEAVRRARQLKLI
jgi:LuxR family transcriptional regulator, maltose regulon positive regulatory protein